MRSPPGLPAIRRPEARHRGVPWRGSVSARLAWGDVLVERMLCKELRRLGLLRNHGTPMVAHLQLPVSSTADLVERCLAHSGKACLMRCDMAV